MHKENPYLLEIFFFRIPIFYSNTGGDPSLNDVYNNMNPPMTKDQWHIHDPSKLVATDGILMIAVTGKAQEDGYK